MDIFWQFSRTGTVMPCWPSRILYSISLWFVFLAMLKGKIKKGPFFPGFKCPAISVKYLQMIPTEVGFKSQNLKIGEGFLLLNQTRLPFDISMESLEPFFISFDGYNFSSAGLRFTFRCSTCPLVFGSWELSHVIFLMLRKKNLLGKLSKFTK